MDDEFNDPHSRLEAIANVAADGDNVVYGLYDQIFKLAFDGLSNRTLPAQTAIINDVYKVVATIVLLIDPLSVHGMARILGLEIRDIRRILKPLTSVIILPEGDNDCIQIFHESFRDFLTSDNVHSPSQFHVDPSVHHRLLASQCLRSLQQPDRNTSLLGYDRSTQDVLTDLDAAVYYSCHHWMSHLEAGVSSHDNIASIEVALSDFLHGCLAYWMECLAYKFDVVCSSVQKMETWLSVCASSLTEANQILTTSTAST